jgi:hypothetical protein
VFLDCDLCCWRLQHLFSLHFIARTRHENNMKIMVPMLKSPANYIMNYFFIIWCADQYMLTCYTSISLCDQYMLTCYTSISHCDQYMLTCYTSISHCDQYMLTCYTSISHCIKKQNKTRIHVMQKSLAKILNYFKYHLLPPLGIIPLHISSGCSNKLLFWQRDFCITCILVLFCFLIKILFYIFHKCMFVKCRLHLH